jgi:hypothetical protein
MGRVTILLTGSSTGLTLLIGPLYSWSCLYGVRNLHRDRGLGDILFQRVCARSSKDTTTNWNFLFKIVVSIHYWYDKSLMRELKYISEYNNMPYVQSTSKDLYLVTLF